MGQDGEQHIGKRGFSLFPFTFAGGSVKCAVLKASFACRREQKSSGFTRVPENSQPRWLSLPFLPGVGNIIPEQPKAEFNSGKCSLRSLLQDALSPWQQGQTLTLQPIFFFKV